MPNDSRLLMLVLLLSLLALPGMGQDLAQRLAARVFQIQPQGKLSYRLFRPAEDGAQKQPLLLFLHGAGERGADNSSQLRHGVADFVSPAAQKAHPCFVLAPQCPRGESWTSDRLQVLLVDLVRSFLREQPVDSQRVYLTGLSMGGYGTWKLLARAPELFAAAVPICGAGDPKLAPAMTRLPIWAFHGAADRVVPTDRTREMIAAIQKAGGQPRMTIYPGVGHDAWTRTYADGKVHAWLFGHRRSEPQLPHVPLKDGDRVIFLGDSITWQGARTGGYVRLLESDLKRLHPSLSVEILGAGISGNKVPDLQKRLQHDVLDEHPSLVLIYIGINDVWHWNHNNGTKQEDFERGLRDIIKQITSAGARVILCTPSVIGEKRDGQNALDSLLETYAGISRKVASDTGVKLLDLRRHFLQHLIQHNQTNLERGVLTKDGVHLNKAGNRFLADLLLRMFTPE